MSKLQHYEVNEMQVYTDDRSSNPLDFCNTCHSLFNDGDETNNGDAACFHQSPEDRLFLSTRVEGRVVQECCNNCADNMMRDYSKSYASRRGDRNE